MSTTSTERSTISLEDMIEQQMEEIDRFVKERERSGGHKVMRARWPQKDWIKRVIDAHIDLLERWGGWRWHSTPFEQMLPLTNAAIGGLIQQESARWITGVTMYENDRAKKAEKLPALPLKAWGDEASMVFCTTSGCHLPHPTANNHLWRTSLYSAPKGQKEGLEPFASFYNLKIRTGQSVTKAVLGEVRRVFKDHPNYVRFWETLAEKFGVSWAASKGVPVTFSFAPVDYLKLGHLGEAGSCYATGGGQEQSKYNLSVLTNSTVVLFYNTFDQAPDPMKLPAGNVRGRAWGLFDLEHEGAAFSNAYLLSFTETMPSIEAALKQCFGWDVTGGRAVGQSFQGFGEYAYTNRDGVVFATDTTEHQVQNTVNAQTKLGESERHIKTPCGSCATPYGHPSMIGQCICGNRVCPNCTKETKCCKAPSCAKCRVQEYECSSCHIKGCGRCMQLNGTLATCIDTNKTFCKACADGKLSACPNCKRLTSNPSTCSIGASSYCQTCAKEFHRACDRCQQTVHLDHVTRCGGCKQRRCDRCQQEGETGEPQSLCVTCHKDGKPQPKQDAVDPKLLEEFKAGIAALPEELRKEFLASMKDFKWSLDDVALAGPDADEEEAEVEE